MFGFVPQPHEALLITGHPEEMVVGYRKVSVDPLAVREVGKVGGFQSDADAVVHKEGVGDMSAGAPCTLDAVRGPVGTVSGQGGV